MSNQNLKDSLLALARGKQDRSQAAQLNDVLAEMDHALAHGVKRQKVWETLRDHGFTLSFDSFTRTLARLRKQRGANAHTAPEV